MRLGEGALSVIVSNYLSTLARDRIKRIRLRVPLITQDKLATLRCTYLVIHDGSEMAAVPRRSARGLTFKRTYSALYLYCASFADLLAYVLRSARVLRDIKQ